MHPPKNIMNHSLNFIQLHIGVYTFYNFLRVLKKNKPKLYIFLNCTLLFTVLFMCYNMASTTCNTFIH